MAKKPGSLKRFYWLSGTESGASPYSDGSFMMFPTKREAIEDASATFDSEHDGKPMAFKVEVKFASK